MPELEHIFSKPADEYMPVPWWAWTGGLEREQMEAQIRDMHAKGIREFFIFPIYGMEVEYMSEAYLDRIGWCIDWCRELGMKLWVYDEYNWPSGVAAGLVPRKHPSAVARNIYVEQVEAVSRELLADPSVLGVFAVEEGASYRRVRTPEQMPAHVYRRVLDQLVSIQVKGAPWTKQEAGWLDMLSDSAVAAFIEEAYEPVARRFPNEFGGIIKGFFTDEPSIAPGNIPWTDGLAERFLDRFGYDIIDKLPELTNDFGDYLRTRVDFWSLATEMYSDGFTGQLARWCGDRGMLLTGHMVYEEDARSVWYQGDEPSHLKHMQVPGCDLLDVNTNFELTSFWYQMWGPKAMIRAPRNPSSTARFHHLKRVMCEAYGVQPWSRTMAHEKFMTDWLGALGVNLFNDNSLISNIHGFRKRAIAGKHFTQPWWEKAKRSYDYIGRFSAMCGETTLDTELLLMYPTTTYWALTKRGQEKGEKLTATDACIDTTLDALLRTHWHWEFLYEYILDASEVKDGALATSNGAFRCIILAGIEYLQPQHAAKLEQFARAGGSVVLIGPAPVALEKNGDRPLDLPNAVRIEDWAGDGFMVNLDGILSDRGKRPWRLSGHENGMISAARFDENGRKAFFLADMTASAKKLTLEWDGSYGVEFWDTASATPWLPAQGPGKVEFTLPADESVWVVQSTGRRISQEPPAHFVTDIKPKMELGGEWQFRTDRPNLLSLELKLLKDPNGSLTAGALPEDGWADIVDGSAGMPLVPEETPFYWLKAEFDAAVSVDDLQLVVDSADIEQAYLNGSSLGPSEPITLWDDHNRAWSLKAHAGRNSLLLRVRTSEYNSQRLAVFPTQYVEPVVLRGHFAADAANQRLMETPKTLEIGDWGKQGFPHFAGVGIYEKRFHWTDDAADVMIGIIAGKDVVDVYLDGVPMGSRAWALRQFRAKLVTSEHVLQVRVTNTLGGILRRSYGGEPAFPIPECGLLEPVRIGVRRERMAQPMPVRPDLQSGPQL